MPRGQEVPVRPRLPLTDLRVNQRPLLLAETDLRRAILPQADLTDADLRRTNLQLADLRGANLRGARLNWADLTLAQLTGANLQNVDLSDADLTGADLRDADLRGALLERTTLAHAQVAGTRGLTDGLDVVRGRVRGPLLANGEVAAGLQAFENGRQLHGQGRLRQAENAYKLALAWEPDSDVVRYALACLALDENDTDLVQLWLEATTQVNPEAQQVHQELTTLRAILAGQPLEPRAGTALSAWALRQQNPQHKQVQSRQSPLVEALQAGDLALANRHLAHLRADEPLAAVWKLLLPKLQATTQAFTALLHTRKQPTSPIQTVKWQSFGAHGLTAKLELLDGSLLWAQRFTGLLRPEASLRYTHEIQTILRENQFLVPEWLPDTTGDPLLLFDGDWLVASRHLPGQPLGQPTLEQLDVAGQTLAKIHLLGLELPPRPQGGLQIGTRLLQGPHPGARWRAELESEPQLLERLGNFTQFQRLPSLLDLATRHLDLTKLPRGLCHGDFAGGNLLLEGEKLAILDWDLADMDVLVWDVARAIDRLALHWRAGQPLQVDRPKLRAFLRGYQRVRPLTNAEKQALPVLCALSRLELDTGLLTLLTPLDPEIVDALLPRVAMRLERAAAGMGEVGEML